MKLSEALEHFCDALYDEVARGTVVWYKRMLLTLPEVLGDMDITEVDRNALRRWRRVTAEKPTLWGRLPSDRTKNAYLTAVKRFFRWLVEEDEVENSPADALRRIPLTNDDYKAVSFEDFQVMLNAALAQRRWRDAAFMLFLMGTGVRVTELVNLRIVDLDLENCHAYVAKKSRKRNSDYHRVYLDEIVVEAIRDYFDYERPTPSSDDEPVFLSRRGQQLHRGTVWRILKEYADNAGLSGYSNPHAFRHGFAMMRVQSGEDIASVSRLMGHSSTRTTSEYYIRWQEGQLREIHQKFSPLNQLDDGGAT